MKVVILAGGLGTRLSEETTIKPKPMVEIGGRPILWHIMKIYSHYGFNEFIICLGYKGYMIKEYFANYFLHQSDITVDLEKNKIETHNNYAEPWKVTLVDTGDNTMTGGRIKRIRDYISDTFLLTYGDGLIDANIQDVLNFHKKEKKLVTVTAVQPVGRYGVLEINGNNEVEQFIEKPKGDRAWVNGGFFVCEPESIEFIAGDNISWEKEPLQIIAKQKLLTAFKHYGFWMSMDTLRDKHNLEELWQARKAPWKVWD